MMEKILFVSWYSPESKFIYPVARLTEFHEPSKFEFVYIRGATEAERHGFEPFLDFPELNKAYSSESLFPMFANRLMPEGRPDYDDFIGRLGLERKTADPLAVLARSGGRRATDRLELFGYPEHDPVAGDLLYRFWARGISHVAHAEERIDFVRPEERLLCALDCQNPTDPNAVALRVEKPRHQILGFLPFYLCDEVQQLHAMDVPFQVVVEKVNLEPAPRHQRLLCLLRTRGGKKFHPFSSDRYAPIADEVPAIDHNDSKK
jgi:hypothetical protein